MSKTTAYTPFGGDNATEARVDLITHLWVAAELWLQYALDKSGSAFLAEASSIFTDVAEDQDAAIELNWLYRLYSEDGRLIYVGVTKNPQARISSHKRKFGTLLDTWTLEPYPDRKAVLAAEARAIDEEHPAFNVDHPNVDVG